MNSSFDHLVGAQKERCGHIDAERLRGLEIDDQLDLGGLLHRQVGRLLALDDAKYRNAQILADREWRGIGATERNSGGHRLHRLEMRLAVALVVAGIDEGYRSLD
jgi:hypothetical protein